MDKKKFYFKNKIYIGKFQLQDLLKSQKIGYKRKNFENNITYFSF